MCIPILPSYISFPNQHHFPQILTRLPLKPRSWQKSFIMVSLPCLVTLIHSISPSELRISWNWDKNKQTLWYHSCRPCINNPHALFKASGSKRHPIQGTKQRHCIPCSRLKTLKTIPCWPAHTRLGQIRECPLPPPPGIYTTTGVRVIIFLLSEWKPVCVNRFN